MLGDCRRWLEIARYWPVWFLLCGPLFLFLTIDWVPLGRNFTIVLASSLVAAACTSLLLSPLLIEASVWLASRFNRIRLPERSTKYRAVMLLGLILFVIGFPLSLFVSKEIQQSRINAADDAARREFNVTTNGEGFDKSEVDRTLAEFHWARDRLRLEWPHPTLSSPISLNLFENWEDYLVGTGRKWSGGSMVCQPTGAVIYVPLEEVVNESTETDLTQVPMHEMAHAMLCQFMGANAFYSLPIWLHEGLAQIYENESKPKRLYRVVNRLVTWFSRQTMMTPEAFCEGQYGDSHSEIASFYRTSMEFVRALESNHGRPKLMAIVDDVRREIAFNDSLLGNFGGTCETLYSEWLDSWR